MKKTWEELFKEAYHRNKAIEYEQHNNKLRKFFLKLLTVEFIVGIIAGILVVSLMGWKSLIEILLSWTIGLTFMTFMISAILRKR